MNHTLRPIPGLGLREIEDGTLAWLPSNLRCAVTPVPYHGATGRGGDQVAEGGDTVLVGIYKGYRSVSKAETTDYGVATVLS